MASHGATHVQRDLDTDIYRKKAGEATRDLSGKTLSIAWTYMVGSAGTNRHFTRPRRMRATSAWASHGAA